MSQKHATIKADPPPNLLYDMKAAARAERRQRRAEAWAQFERAYVIIGATAGFMALLILVAR